MRTTIVIEDDLFFNLRKLVKSRKLSQFINTRLREYFLELEKIKREASLEASYQRANRDCQATVDYEKSEVEGWPEW